MSVEVHAAALAAPAAEPAAPAPSAAPAPAQPAAARQQGRAGKQPPAAVQQPAATAEPPAAPPPEERQLAKLMQRHQQLELQHRKAEQGRKALEQKLAEIEAREQATERRLKEDPYGLLKEKGVGSQEWAKAFLQQDEGPKVPPEVQKRLDELENRYKQQDEEKRTQAEQAERNQFTQAVDHAMRQAPDLAFSARLGQAEKVADQIRSHRSEYGDCTEADQRRIAQQVEGETRKAVSDLLEKLSGAAGFSELIQKYAAAAAAEASTAAASSGNPGERTQPAARPAGETGKATSTNARRKALTRAQAAQVTARSSGGPRTRTDSKAAALKRLEERARARS